MKFANQTLSLLLVSGMLGIAPSFAADSTSAGNAQFIAKAPGGGGPGGSCKGSGACSRGHRRGFSLTDEQLEKMNSLKNDFLSSTSSQRSELFSLKRQEKDLITKPDSDRSQIMALQDKINSLKASLANSRLKYKLDKFAVLTSEQQKQVRHRMLLGQAMGGHHKFKHRQA